MMTKLKGMTPLLQVFDMPTSELRDKGVAIDDPRTAPYGMKQLFLKDPDGYGLCLQWRDDVGTIEWEREQGHVRRDDG